MVPFSKEQTVTLNAMNETDEKKIRDRVNFYDGIFEKYDKQLFSYLNHTPGQLLDHIGEVPDEHILNISRDTGLFTCWIENGRVGSSCPLSSRVFF